MFKNINIMNSIVYPEMLVKQVTGKETGGIRGTDIGCDSQKLMLKNG